MGRLEMGLWACDFIIGGVGWALGGPAGAMFCFLVGGILVFIVVAKEDKTAQKPSRLKKWHRYGMATFALLAILVGGFALVRQVIRKSATTTAQNSTQPQPHQQATPQQPPATVSAAPKKPPTSIKPQKQPQQDNSVHLDGNSKIEQQSSGNCSPNIVGGSSTVNCVPPEPTMSWTQKPYDLGPTYKPAVMVYMTLDGNLNLPAFLAICDRPCGVQEGSVDSIPTTPGPILNRRPNETGMVFKAPRPVGVGQHPYLIIESKDNYPVRVIRVLTLTKTQLPAGVD